MSQNGLALEFVEEDLCNCREIALAAVSNNGLALEFFLNFFHEDVTTESRAMYEDVVMAAGIESGFLLFINA